MSFNSDLDLSLRRLNANVNDEQKMLERFRAEIDFGAKLAHAYPEQSSAWQSLLLQAVELVRSGGITAISAAETLLAPLGAIAKQYTVHCVGHAHIDMNWMWSWPETVATTNDTFTTVDRLMDEYPEFTFSQSQTSVYQILKDYLPELYERVKARVASGRWEVTAAQWVEGDKNMANGEIITRHLLYSKRFFTSEFGIPFDDLQVCWEPDTFGHARTTPSLLAAGGVKYYYFCRAHNGKPQLFWWQGKDGARVLAFDDFEMWYNGTITPPEITRRVLPFAAETGCKDYLFVYGVGDHGGGPTRRDLNMLLNMANWPIFPQVQFSTAARFFKRVEETAQNLPVVDTEMNYVFEGCYTSQSNIKYANRKSENALTEAETFALLGREVGIPYPSAALYKAWQHAMLNQFHDILPGSGVKATYQHAQGLFQE
ncbi:MAG: alpha-mannosidase, partial [bacterium]